MGITDIIVSLRRMTKSVIKRFNRIYYDSVVWGNGNTKWLGIPILKSPTDVWIYQEIVYEIKPDIVIETGTFNGGSALYFASLFDMVGNGEIVTVDIEERKGRPQHKRITYLKGFSTSNEILAEIKRRTAGKEKVMVVLDSDHSRDNVLKELRTYNELVTKGSYLIVEDTNLNGHPVAPDFGPGPMEAIEEFLKENKNFAVDNSKEKFLLTFNPKGYLKRL